MLRPLLGFSLSLLVCACASSGGFAETINYRYRVVESFPHDRSVFTQGLVYHQGKLFESAGQYGQSRLLVRTLASSEALQLHQLPDTIFAEGITLMEDRLFQLSWRSGRVFVYDAQTLKPLREYSLAGEGWGLTHNGRELIVSDGSAVLQFIDPDKFTVSRRLAVTLDGKPITQINELEWIDGHIYANIWQSNWIIIIDPESGEVVGKVRLNQLLPDDLRTTTTDVLNGIAYDHDKKRLLVTGKYWPRIYHIELIR